jgi:hypothetical protein
MQTLGKLIREIEIDGSIFYVRGLTVGEYCDIAMRGLFKDSDRLWVEVSMTGIVGWDNIFAEDECGDPIELPYAEEYKQSMDLEHLVYLGKKIYEELTILSDEEHKKFEAATRFLHFSGDPKNRSIIDTFDCSSCIKKGLARTRPCGRFSDEEIERMMAELREDKESITDDPEKLQKEVKSKYKAKRTKMAFPSEIEQAEQKRKEKKTGIVLDKYNYPECPISYIDTWISILCGILYHCAKSNVTFFSGGIVDQPYKYYRAERVVSSESSKIEMEEMEKSRKESEQASRRR